MQKKIQSRSIANALRRNILSLFEFEHFDQSMPRVRLETARAFNTSITKRILDLAIAIPAFVILLPFMVLIGIIIRLDSKGPALFKHKRVGLNGKIFDMYKFRSMYQNVTDAIHKQHIDAYAHGKINENEGVKLKWDPRVTRVGRIIRSTSIDELPQLINVIKGDMSLVGPRPVPIYEADYYNLWQSERLGTLPGMTGLWQVSGRSSVSFEEMIRLDIRYIRNQSLWLNILILIKTIPAILSRKGAG